VIADTIDLGLDCFVFLDDNPAERKRVRDALPMVAVPELPEDASDWLPVFQAAGYFEQTDFSKEDAQRAGFYKANALRSGSQRCSPGPMPSRSRRGLRIFLATTA
jgi:predicted enzyme involved in methoxymalonyl-ACP biosynthesis